jgi:hypothetical protein
MLSPHREFDHVESVPLEDAADIVLLGLHR